MTQLTVTTGTDPPTKGRANRPAKSWLSRWDDLPESLGRLVRVVGTTCPSRWDDLPESLGRLVRVVGTTLPDFSRGGGALVAGMDAEFTGLIAPGYQAPMGEEHTDLLTPNGVRYSESVSREGLSPHAPVFAMSIKGHACVPLWTCLCREDAYFGGNWLAWPKRVRTSGTTRTSETTGKRASQLAHLAPLRPSGEFPRLRAADGM